MSRFDFFIPRTQKEKKFNNFANSNVDIKQNAMKTNIPERIAALREAMKQHKIDAYIIPTSDPHMSEYPADCWKYQIGRAHV